MSDVDWAAVWAEMQAKSARNCRYHCEACGRFVPSASVKVSYTRWDGERIIRGECARHGPVRVAWGRS